ncbi:MAG: phytanoyl-CoA dioxygenase family protein [Pirellulaceae bacterium]|nr:phytanoyl-CoA dioxygenase family protein [Pirellulaceae bacterium]
MKIQFGKSEVELGGNYLAAELKDSTSVLDDVTALKRRLDEDGYLLLRGFHDRELVLDARRSVLEHLAKFDCIDDGTDLMEGRMKLGGKAPRMTGQKVITHTEPVLALLEHERVFEFFGRIFGTRTGTFDYKWLRAVGKTQFTGAHYDVVYMGRGSTQLCTCWTPFGDIDIDQGPLALCVGSHKLPGFEKVRATYGRMDVDRDLVEGIFSNDPVEIVDQFGGQWQTTSFRAGDVLILGMFTMHASLTNSTDRWRISCDTRFQPADEEMDDRWIGEKPREHYASGIPSAKIQPIEDARADWGL